MVSLVFNLGDRVLKEIFFYYYLEYVFIWLVYKALVNKLLFLMLENG